MIAPRELVRLAWARLRALGYSARLTGLAVLLLAVALLHPRANVERDAYDYVVALDVTQSMNALDVELDGRPVSRLAFAKQRLKDALRDLPCGSRVGWAVFTEYRTLLLLAPVEVCENYHDLVATLEHVDGRMSWAGASEVAKGIYWGLRTVKELPGSHGLVFVTDGHEAPPVHPRHRPQYDGKPGEIRGLIVGVGGDALVPIPKVDPEGKSLGVWGKDEVLQTDTYSGGRKGSGGNEVMVDESGKAETSAAASGTEHLSSLKAEYLQQIARETGLSYYRLADQRSFLKALTAEELARPAEVRVDLRAWLGIPALLLLALAHLPRLRGIARIFRGATSRLMGKLSRT